ncbi:MAG: nuclear transport factor 2 family protein [Gammaproteobacteria bacterium]|nr:nuclear transport factor 2 family protein [Gammaproteobacteria bacterium]
MRITFGNAKILLHLSAIALVAVPAWATDDDSSTMSQEGCAMSAREVVDQFIDLFYVKKEVRLAFETWVHPDYIQHKPSLPDGREPVIVFLEKLLERFPDRTFTIHRVISSDDLVAVHCHSQATPEDLGFAVVDIFRVEDCHMVEHWDVVQSVPAHSENDNTMF